MNFKNKISTLAEKKHNVESSFYEYLKMRTFLERSIGMNLGINRFVPLQIIPGYIYSLLLIDLFSVWGNAVDYILEKNGIKKSGSSEKNMKALESSNLLQQAAYIRWYIDWRNDVAHRQRKVEYFELNQATEDIRKQLITWDLFFDKSFHLFYESESEDTFKIGVKIGDYKILEYTINFIEQPIGLTSSWNESVNLTFEDYLDFIKSKV